MAQRRLGILRTYRWVDKDPLCDMTRAAFEQTGLKKSQVAELSGVAVGTLTGWWDGDVRKPQNSTSTAVLGALGCVRHDRLNRDGTVTVGYDRVRDLNKLEWRKELDKAADFWAKQNTPKRKRKRKAKTMRAPDLVPA